MSPSEQFAQVRLHTRVGYGLNGLADARHIHFPRGSSQQMTMLRHWCSQLCSNEKSLIRRFGQSVRVFSTRTGKRDIVTTTGNVDRTSHIYHHILELLSVSTNVVLAWRCATYDGDVFDEAVAPWGSSARACAADPILCKNRSCEEQNASEFLHMTNRFLLPRIILILLDWNEKSITLRNRGITTFHWLRNLYTREQLLEIVWSVSVSGL